MALDKDTISSNVFDFLKSRFDLGESVDEDGQSTMDSSKMKVFTFDFKNAKGDNLGCVVVSLIDDSESINSLKVYFGDEIGNADADSQKEWFKFLQELRLFAKINMLGFDVRNINKSTITRRDIEPMFESTFGPIDGTVKTSRQPLENMQIIIKHTARINPNIKNCRSRKIQKIYLANNKGEKFLLPFKSLMAARAMARHIYNGGTPYDKIGSDICDLVEEMNSLSTFVRHMKNVEFDNPEAINAITASKERYNDIKKELMSLSSDGGYNKRKLTLTGNEGIIEEDDNLPDFFGEDTLENQYKMALPYVKRAYLQKRHIPEEGEFEKWVAAAHGQGKGEEMLADEDEEENKLTEADFPSSSGALGPFSRPCLKQMNDFHSPKQIKTLKNVTGKESPLSLISSEEQDDDDDDIKTLKSLSGI
jgi:hypothetical protein